MRKCPVCGNVDFKNINTNADFLCPVAGCGGIIAAETKKSGIPAWVRPKGGAFGWADEGKKSEQDKETDDGAVLIRPLNDEQAEVFGFRKEAQIPKDLAIPASWRGHRVVQLAPYALKGLDGVVQLKLPDTLERIGFEACAMCGSLEMVEFGSSIVLVDAFAFRDCARLRTFKMSKTPECVMETAFAGCFELSETERSKIFRA